jgi:hypothetical protein
MKIKPNQLVKTLRVVLQLLNILMLILTLMVKMKNKSILIREKLFKMMKAKKRTR